MSQLGFWRIAQETPDRLAVVTPDGEEHSFGELLARCNQVTHGALLH
jgi:long-chain acyl-CoA synthetase